MIFGLCKEFDGFKAIDFIKISILEPSLSTLLSTPSDLNSTIISSDDEPEKSMVQIEEYLKMTKNYHQMRMKVVNLTYTVQKQQGIIEKQLFELQALEKNIKSIKSFYNQKIEEMNQKHKHSSADRNSVLDELRVAKKIISMEKYSKELRNKMKEFDVLDSK